ncbi:unnamed protein product [Sphenostylis stenocarpa]|uniref:Ubiquitin fusion degradation protein UFD1 N-terminal subdomain 1 domain-containing protein n=1 Tax=Sphenostylis stenocarpa TaxID=92480 RepID=A0AA86VKJ4_9FABA|nr:unnamed protein product [Sphenostylis stenocarpa]
MENESNNLDQQESSNWESDNWSIQEESNDWESNEHEYQQNNWEPNEHEQEENNSEANEEQSHNWESESWNESENWNEYEYNNWDEQEQDYNEWDGTFKDVYRCYPLSAIDKINLENGGKIIMPPSALSLLMYLEIEYPMLFELTNPSTEKVTHCGVQEFTADEGNMYMPKWMMENMNLEEGSNVNVRSIQLPTGTFVKLQPHTKDFLEMSNPKAVYELSPYNLSQIS